MITVTIADCFIQVSGHATRPNGVPSGQNIICAAVSALTLTLIEGLREVADLDLDVEERSGYVYVSWDYLNPIGQALLDTYEIGMKCIRDSYGEIEIL